MVTAYAMFATAPAITRIVNLALRASDRSTSGHRTLFSTTTNAASASSDPASAIIVVTESQPQLGARSNVNVNNPIPVLMSASPATSMRRGADSSNDSLMTLAPITSDTNVSGRFSQKIHRQPMVSVNTPPMSGPAAFPKAAMP